MDRLDFAYVELKVWFINFGTGRFGRYMYIFAHFPIYFKLIEFSTLVVSLSVYLDNTS